MNHINTPQGTDLQNVKAKYIMDPSVTMYASCALAVPPTIRRKVQRNSFDHSTEGATELLRPFNGRRNSFDHPTEGATELLRPSNGRCNGTPSTIQRKVQQNSSDHPTEGATELLRPSNGRCSGTLRPFNGRCSGTPEVKSCEKGGLAASGNEGGKSKTTRIAIRLAT